MIVSMHFQHVQLENGLTIIGEVNPAAQSAAVGFFVRTGSRDETASISGVSHFLEHMLFKGTRDLTSLEVNEAFDRLGAKFNALPVKKIRYSMQQSCRNTLMPQWNCGAA